MLKNSRYSRGAGHPGQIWQDSKYSSNFCRTFVFPQFFLSTFCGLPLTASCEGPVQCDTSVTVLLHVDVHDNFEA
jgi:hypothetical protein